MRYLTFFIAIMVLALFAMSQTSQAQYVLGPDDCGQWANYCAGGYCVYNNIWGQVEGSSQCITAVSCTEWYVDAYHPPDGVKSYPNSSREMGGENVTIGSLTSCSSTMSVSVPATGDFCTAWDVWAPEEVMIWINKYGAVGPWGSYVETATIGGVTWDVYKNGYPGFLTQTNTNSMTVDIKAILDYCVSKGWLSNSGVIDKIQGGFEISGTAGATQRFTMNNYSVSYSTGGTTSSTTTTMASTTTTTGATTTTTTAGGGCTCDAGCDSRTTKTLPFTQNGTGEYCWETGGTLNSVNSWNLDVLEINGVDYTNTWSNSFPAKINGVYYIYYKSTLPWGHFEADGSGGTTTTTTAVTSTTTTTAASTTTTTAATTTTTAVTTTTTAGGGCTCDAGCESRTTISPSFTQEGAGEYCWEATSLGGYINSWALDKLEINDVDYTNIWSNSFPEKINGVYYIYYKGSHQWSHFETISTAKANNFAKIEATEPTEFQLAQNYPNPFNPETNINYQLPEDGDVLLEIFDLQGHKVKTLVHGRQNAGAYTVVWNSLNEDEKRVTSGIYVYRIKVTTENRIFTKSMKMALLK